jgi:predicted lipoprotein
MNRRLRAIVLVAAVWLCAGISFTPSLAPAAAAKAIPATAPNRPIRFSGQVVALDGLASGPTGFRLQVNSSGRVIDFHINQISTTFTARTAEAQVVGFGQYDFATVVASRANAEWTAVKVLYDVVPFGPIRDFTVTGRVVNADKKGRSALLRLASGDTHVVRLTAMTKYEINGIITDAPIALVRDSIVEVTVHRNVENVWVATTVNLKQAPPVH